MKSNLKYSWVVARTKIACTSWEAEIPKAPGPQASRLGGLRPASRLFLFFVIFHVTQCFRAGYRASGPAFGWILIGEASKSAFRPAESRPEGRF